VLSPPRPTLRLRLTCFYGALFLLSGAVLLAVTYLLVRFTFPAASGYPHAASHPRPGAALTPLPSLATLRAQDASQRRADLHQLLMVSGAALGAMVLLSVLLGWLVAGRVLRPLRTITAAARDNSSATLDRRLALPGPDDELKELGDTFDGLLDRLERSFRAQQRFVANASHELRTPLTLQRALIEAALSDPTADPASLRGSFDRLLALTADQQRLINALLTLAASEKGIDAPAQVDLAEPARRVIKARRADAARVGVTLDLALAPAPTRADPELVERLVANLVDNALRYNEPGGRVDVTTGPAADDVTLAIGNTGPAVPASAIEDLFQPFRRLDGRRAGGDAGHGLGLSIVAAIAAAHGAIVEASPGGAGGLQVTVRFQGLSPTPGAAGPGPEGSRADRGPVPAAVSIDDELSRP
jgi:signal transduction histidine kinase